MTIKIYNQDCMEAMANMEDNQFDLAIVDPPYGINMSSKKKYRQNAFTVYNPKKWDSKAPGLRYFQELFRVSLIQVIWGANYFAPYLPSSKKWIVWDKKVPDGMSFSMHELAFYNGSKQAKIFRYQNDGNKCTVKDKVKELRIHPTQKPVALYKWLIQNYANEGDQILDTHLGSGSIAIACHDMGFDLEAYEIDKEYYDAAKQRLETHQSQLQLF